MNGPRAGLLGRLVLLGKPGGDGGAEQRRARRERPDQVEATGVLKQHADRGPERQPGPDGEAVEADHPAAGLLRGHVHVPRRACDEDGSLAGAEEEARDDQARDPGRDEVERPGDGGEQRPDDHGRLAPPGIGDVPRDRAADDARERERPGDDPDLEVGAVQVVLHVVGEDGQGRADGEQAEVGDDEDSREAGPGGGRGRLRHQTPRSWARRILPLGVFGSSSVNSTMRGYLYGAVTRLT